MIQLPITLDQLILTVQQLQPSDREQVAKALIQIELKLDLKALLEELYKQPPIDEITDSEIMNEIKAVLDTLSAEATEIPEQLKFNSLRRSQSASTNSIKAKP
jgi:hypothetical protein